MKNKKIAFTLVELIVVITILAILSTLWFVAYTDYLKWVRDSSRIQQMTEIHKAATLYWVRSRLPRPDRAVSIVSWLSSIGDQWYASQDILDTIKYSDGGVDPKTKDFYTYFVSSDRKYSQILWFFEERSIGNLLTFTSSYADEGTDYSSLYPWVVGAELWVLLDESTQVPIQEIEEYSASGSLDILTATGTFLSYVTNNNVTSGIWQELIGMVPKINCKKILNSLGSADSGIYKINPSGQKQIDIYCDMETDGGGWTFVGHIDNDTNGPETYFNANIWTYDTSLEDNSETFMLDMRDFYHSEMLVLFNEADIQTANENSQLLQLKYDVLFNPFTQWPVTPCSWDLLWDSDGFFYRSNISDSFSWSTGYACNATNWILRASDNTYMLAFRDVISGDGNGTGARYAPNVWDSEDTTPHSWWHDAWFYIR